MRARGKGSVGGIVCTILRRVAAFRTHGQTGAETHAGWANVGHFVSAYNDMVSPAIKPSTKYRRSSSGLRVEAGGRGVAVTAGGVGPHVRRGGRSGQTGDGELSMFSRDVIRDGHGRGLAHNMFDSALWSWGGGLACATKSWRGL